MLSDPAPNGGSQRPIGVFDSGIGGLTVVAAIRALLPNEHIIYIGDTARVPYGGKSAETVERYSLEIATLLQEEGAKAVVVACNTASALALPRLQNTLSVPVLGVISPGARAAVAATRSRHVGVIGTRATIRSGAYERALRSLDDRLRVVSRACPLLVPLIEEGWLDHDVTERVVRDYVAPLVSDGIDTLVLGCTHYPLLRGTLAKVLGPDVALVDSAENCARAVLELLDQEQLRSSPDSVGRLSVALTDRPDAFLDVAERALQLDVGEVQLREVLHSAA